MCSGDRSRHEDGPSPGPDVFDSCVGCGHVDGATGGGCEGGVGDAVARRVGDAESVRCVFDQMPLILAGYRGAERTIVAVSEAARNRMGQQDLSALTRREAVPAL